MMKNTSDSEEVNCRAVTDAIVSGVITRCRKTSGAGSKPADTPVTLFFTSRYMKGCVDICMYV